MEKLQTKFVMVVCGKRKLIYFEKGENCLCAISNPFWKEPKGHYCMQTRESTKKQMVNYTLKYDYKDLR